MHDMRFAIQVLMFCEREQIHTTYVSVPCPFVDTHASCLQRCLMYNYTRLSKKKGKNQASQRMCPMPIQRYVYKCECMHACCRIYKRVTRTGSQLQNCVVFTSESVSACMHRNRFTISQFCHIYNGVSECMHAPEQVHNFTILSYLQSSQ